VTKPLELWKTLDRDGSVYGPMSVMSVISGTCARAGTAPEA